MVPSIKWAGNPNVTIAVKVFVVCLLVENE